MPSHWHQALLSETREQTKAMLNKSRSLRFSYSVLAPLYDSAVEKTTSPMRQRSLRSLSQFIEFKNNTPSSTIKILIDGIGSGLDLPHLVAGPDYVGLDLTPNMLQRASRRNPSLNCQLHIGDAMSLPYAASSFDAVLLHLILAVTPEPETTLTEAIRVLKPGGRLFVMDKFLRPGQWAPLRRLLNPAIRRFATQTNIVWEKIYDEAVAAALKQDPAIRLRQLQNEADLGGGWFRRIILERY